MVLATGFAGIALNPSGHRDLRHDRVRSGQPDPRDRYPNGFGRSRRLCSTLVLKRGLLLAFGGTLLGLAASLALTRLLCSVLYSVRPHDPLTLAAVVLVLNWAALLFCYVPARRATRIDPVEALRYG